MEKEEIITGNKLIADFMGVRIKGAKGAYQYKVDDQMWAEEGLRYNSNWNWLIPVMEKIGQEYNVRITWTYEGVEVTYIDRPDVRDDTSIADFGGFGAITNTWKCAGKFIIWWNQKTKNK